MAHDALVEATVIGVPHEKWRERPLACVVTADGCDLDEDELLNFLDDELDQPGWWYPDEIKEVQSIPKSATGKFDKKDLRDQIEMKLTDE